MTVWGHRRLPRQGKNESPQKSSREPHIRANRRSGSRSKKIPRSAWETKWQRKDPRERHFVRPPCMESRNLATVALYFSIHISGASPCRLFTTYRITRLRRLYHKKRNLFLPRGSNYVTCTVFLTNWIESVILNFLTTKDLPSRLPSSNISKQYCKANMFHLILNVEVFCCIRGLCDVSFSKITNISAFQQSCAGLKKNANERGENR